MCPHANSRHYDTWATLPGLQRVSWEFLHELLAVRALPGFGQQI
jgi:hypothetical protein